MQDSGTLLLQISERLRHGASYFLAYQIRKEIVRKKGKPRNAHFYCAHPALHDKGQPVAIGVKLNGCPDPRSHIVASAGRPIYVIIHSLTDRSYSSLRKLVN